MSRIAIVTDSTVNLPNRLLTQYPITVLPQTLILENQTYADGIDIQPSEFYSLLEDNHGRPTSSQVSQQAFYDTFSRLMNEYDGILAVLISSKLSGTYQSAAAAQRELNSAQIALIDSQSASLGLGFQVLTAARAAAHGQGLEEVRHLVEGIKSRSGALFLVDTLEYLYRGGRIGGASRFVGTALDVKPILELKDGQVEGIERVRSEKKAIDHLMERFNERIRGKSPLHVGVVHARAYDPGSPADGFHPIPLSP